MGDVERFKIIIGIVNAGDGDGLWREPVAVGEGQCATDGRRIGIAAFRRDGDVVGWGGVEPHSVGLAAGLSHSERGGREAQAGGVIVVGGEGVVADRDAGVAATAGGVADGRGAVAGIDDGVVNAGDGDGLCRAKVAGGEGQRSTDVRRRVVATGGGDGDAAARLRVEDDGVGRRTAVFTGTAAGGGQGDAGEVGGDVDAEGVADCFGTVVACIIGVGGTERDVGAADGDAGDGQRGAGHCCRGDAFIAGGGCVAECVLVGEGVADVDADVGALLDALVGNGIDHHRCGVVIEDGEGGGAADGHTGNWIIRKISRTSDGHRHAGIGFIDIVINCTDSQATMALCLTRRNKKRLV